MNEIHIDFNQKDVEMIDKNIKDKSLKNSLSGMLDDKPSNEIFYSYEDVVYACHKYPSIYNAVKRFFISEAKKDPKISDKSLDLWEQIEKNVFKYDHPKNDASKMN